MNNQHTPGPWLNHGCSVYSAKVWSEGIATGDRYIASSQPLDDSMRSDEDLANARLIAAAPELLAVARSAIEPMDALIERLRAQDLESGRIAAECVRRDLLAAIAKAEGQS